MKAFICWIILSSTLAASMSIDTLQLTTNQLPEANSPKAPFPKWLTDFTGMTEWPGLEPPYIPLDFINFSLIPHGIEKRQIGVCDNVPNTHEYCSFDCHNCISNDDVYTCPRLSQTFDDGPSPSTLKLLKGLESKATFFTLGVNVVQYPEVYKKAVAKGHIMGTHTWSHKFLPSLTNEGIVAQLEWSIWAMNATLGHLPKWFRPPFGGLDNRVRTILRQFGMQAVLWNFDTFDWKLMLPKPQRRERDIYRDVKKFKKKRGNKGLILEHDFFDKTVKVGLGINNILGSKQLTVPQCVGGIDYIKTFPID